MADLSLIRTQSRLHHLGRTRVKHTRVKRCEIPSCSRATREGKPFCPDHVEDHPYARSLIEALVARRVEEALVLERGAQAASLDGITAKEIIGSVSVYGSRTVERIARELSLDRKTVEGYAQALARGKRVHLTKTKRGAVVVNLGPKPKVKKREQAGA